MKKSNKYIIIGASVMVASFVIYYISRGKTTSRLEKKGYS